MNILPEKVPPRGRGFPLPDPLLKTLRRRNRYLRRRNCVDESLINYLLLGGSYYPSTFAASLAKYVTIKSAPARRIDSSDSIITRSGSSQPRANAACSIEYSPET